MTPFEYLRLCLRVKMSSARPVTCEYQDFYAREQQIETKEEDYRRYKINLDYEIHRVNLAFYSCIIETLASTRQGALCMSHIHS